MEDSRRSFLKVSLITTLGLSVLDASMLKLPRDRQHFHYFIKDAQVVLNEDIKADNVLVVNGDISDIYTDLKSAFASYGLIVSVSSVATFFVLSTMAADYGMRVAYKHTQGNVCAWILAPKGVRV